jgi:hypothetical protein
MKTNQKTVDQQKKEINKRLKSVSESSKEMVSKLMNNEVDIETSKKVGNTNAKELTKIAKEIKEMNKGSKNSKS